MDLVPFCNIILSLSTYFNCKFCVQDKVTKQALMELALSEQLRGRQEMEKKFQKLAKTMDYLERAKREESIPLVEAAYQQRLAEEKMLHEREQQVIFFFLVLLWCAYCIEDLKVPS